MIDLHTHSTASDGTLSPEALVDLAAEKGLTAIALTDHDTVAGVAAALGRGALRRVQVIPGVELGVDWNGPGQMHILGYNLRYQDAQLQERLTWLRKQRRERAGKIVTKLNTLGVGVSFERVEKIAGGHSIGRPHVARALLETGSVATLSEAFALYLAPGKPAYVHKQELGDEEAIQLVKACGGAAVLAHPTTLKLDAEALCRSVERLKSYGLRGLEVFWSGHSPEQVDDYQRLAYRLGLLPTGGSDFHGDNKPGIELGTGRNNNVQVPDWFLSAIAQSCPAMSAHAAQNGGVIPNPSRESICH